MRKLRTLDELEADYFQKRPDEIDSYIKEIFEEYAADGDSSALLASLRVIVQVKGITVLASKTGMTRQGIQKTLSSKGNPKLDNINSIIHALGYRLIPQKIEL